MKTVIRVALLTVGATLFYAYVGHMVPQKITYPPESVELSADMTTEQMIATGEKIVTGKGTCMSCHTIGSHSDGLRFPDLGGIGERAGSRKEGLSDVEYLAESLYEPNAYIVEGFNPGMLPASKPPIALNDLEILTVIAYLQSLGGTPNVTMETTHNFTGAAPVSTDGGATAAAAVARPSNMSGAELIANYGCQTCHHFETNEKLLGPSLHDVGNRLDSPALYESILSPDATIADGFDAGLMANTLNAMQFYDKVTAAELNTMVEYLASLKGGE